MLKFFRSSRCLLLLPLLWLGACQHATESETAPTGPSVLSAAATQQALEGKVSFRNHLKPVLESRCLPCHNGKTVIGLFELTSREKAFQPGPLGPRIIPGQPDKSLLFLNPGGTHKAVQVMPPVGNRLTPDELKLLRRWIVQGAEWPAGSAGKLMNAP
jgi:cytochrome c5